MERNTFQKTLITKAIHALNHPTAESVYAYVSNTYPNISKATVYRILGHMALDKDALRIAVPNEPDHFDYQTHKHYHFHCDECHQLFDIDIPYKNELNSFNPACDFIIKNHSLTFHGICKKCQTIK